ncbi:MAG: DUF2071 domain-containing protein [Acidobacteriota bacterium]|nr:DUF2071 domain-containing protein [Acidobacteriota bacterium]MDH3527961.1 DUF2071 domain-containing protein [Acidobacteriota bacterium]
MNRFLTARWEDLIMANYAVDPSLIEELLPKGTEIDLFDGKCYVSLVAFRFVDTRVLGIPFPFHKDFEEVNLRFYVTRDTGEEIRRGVVFVKEIVPKPLITFVARTLYGEPYETWSMSHNKTASGLTYKWSDKNSSNRLHIETGDNLGVPKAGSLEEFIIEHYWGYTKRGNRRTDEYRVAHPKWELFDINYVELDVDFEKCYGKRFGFMKDTEPDSILLAKGSEIEVFKGEKLRIV